MQKIPHKKDMGRSRDRRWQPGGVKVAGNYEVVKGYYEEDEDFKEVVDKWYDDD